LTKGKFSTLNSITLAIKKPSKVTLTKASGKRVSTKLKLEEVEHWLPYYDVIIIYGNIMHAIEEKQ
jgi:hypothetical protein